MLLTESSDAESSGSRCVLSVVSIFVSTKSKTASIIRANTTKASNKGSKTKNETEMSNAVREIGRRGAAAHLTSWNEKSRRLRMVSLSVLYGGGVDFSWATSARAFSSWGVGGRTGTIST